MERIPATKGHKLESFLIIIFRAKQEDFVVETSAEP